MAKPKERKLAKIDQLKANLEEKLQQDEHAIETGHAAKGLGRRMTAPQKRAYLVSLNRGGSRHHLIEQACAATDRDKRIKFIADLMATAEWRSVLSVALASVWGVTTKAVRDYSSVASDLIHDAFGSKEELANTLHCFLEEVMHDALDNGDRRSAIGAARTIAEMAGILVQKTEVSGPNGGPVQHAMLSTLSDEELNRRMIETLREEVRLGRLKRTEIIDLLENKDIPDGEIVEIAQLGTGEGVTQSTIENGEEPVPSSTTDNCVTSEQSGEDDV